LHETFWKGGLLDQVLDLAAGHLNGDLLRALWEIVKQASLAGRATTGVQHWRDNGSAFKATHDLIAELFAALRPSDTVNDLLTRIVKHAIRGAVVQELAKHNWLSERYADPRKNIFENWLKTQQLRLAEENAEPLDMKALTERIGVLDNDKQPSQGGK
jgi:hypothetical protein